MEYQEVLDKDDLLCPSCGKLIAKKIKYKEHQITVSYAHGYNDCYYWDEEYFLVIDNKPYIMFATGSAWESTEFNNSLKQVNFDYLKDRKKEHKDDDYDDVCVSDFREKLFIKLFDFMLENSATEVQAYGRFGDYKLEVVEK